MKITLRTVGISAALLTVAHAAPQSPPALTSGTSGNLAPTGITPFEYGYIDAHRRHTRHEAQIAQPLARSAAAASEAIGDKVSRASTRDKYIVILKNGQIASMPSGNISVQAADTSKHGFNVKNVLTSLGLAADHPDVSTTYKHDGFHGFTASLDLRHLDLLRDDSRVALVEKVQLVSIQTSYERQDGTWGLQRISSAGTPSGNFESLTFKYEYEDGTLGAGVDIYVVDTGINTEHIVFGGRASMLWSSSDVNTDDAGHGTHVSGTAGGSTFGVASGANLLGVKVLDSKGTGGSDATIQGILKVVETHNARKSQPNFKGSVMSMSWSLNAPSPAIDLAIQNAISAGIHSVVAAGNNASDACTFSPSANGGTGGKAISVGSIDTTNAISSFSDTGACVDVYAPGEHIISAYIGGPNVIFIDQGTSMATPHVSGLVATAIIQKPELANDPAGMKSFIASEALKGVVTGTTRSGDQMLLANNGVTLQSKAKRGNGYTIRKAAPGLAGLTARAMAWLDRRQTFWLTATSGPRLV